MSKAKKLKVMLVTPPYHAGVVESAGVWMPVAFTYVAGSLRANGHDVEIYDAMSTFDNHRQIRDHIASRRPDMIAMTAITASAPACLKVCKNAREDNPEIITVIGNMHATFMWKQMLTDHPELDIVVRGEGELTIVELADALANGGDLAKVPGLAYRSEGKPKTTKPRERLADLDPLPLAWDLMDWPMYTYRPRPGSTLAVISSSRGCMQACSFCSQQQFWERTWRPRSAENFVAEIEYLKREHGVSVAMLSDETPTTDRVRWEKILDLLIERQVGVELLMETRVDDILRDEDILEKYARADISHIYVGIETTNQDTLDVWKKDITVAQSKRAIELINSHDIVSETSFVMGMPDETPESIARTIEQAKHFGPDLAFFLAITPWPYSPLYAELKDHIATDDYAKYNLVGPVVKPEAMTIAEMTKALGGAAHQFYADKLARLEELTPLKRTFMVKVLRILMEHSYLAAEMRGLKGEMPESVKKMMAALEAADA
jgi:anaerobic magnesium-protoporphyrin IX monomethyl ester cyclase